MVATIVERVNPGSRLTVKFFQVKSYSFLILRRYSPLEAQLR